MAEVNGSTLQETHDKLKDYYDGYHFSRRNMVDVYNPFGLIDALDTQDLNSYWASAGATSMLPKFIKEAEWRLPDLGDCIILRNTL